MFRKTLILAVVAGASLLAAGPGTALCPPPRLWLRLRGWMWSPSPPSHGRRLRSSDGELWLRRSGDELRLQCSGSGPGSLLLCPGSVVLCSGPVVLRSVGCAVLRRSWPRHHGSSSPGSWPPSGSTGSSAGRAGSAEAEGLVCHGAKQPGTSNLRLRIQVRQRRVRSQVRERTRFFVGAHPGVVASHLRNRPQAQPLLRNEDIPWPSDEKQLLLRGKRPRQNGSSRSQLAISCPGGRPSRLSKGRPKVVRVARFTNLPLRRSLAKGQRRPL